jgi:methyl-accepting chemotaxis protein
VQYMEIGSREVEIGAQIITRSGNALRALTDAVGRTNELSHSMALAMHSQADRTGAVDRAMHEIAAVVEENAASAEETAAAAQQQTACMEEIAASAQELADMALELDKSVHRFKLEEDAQ